MTTLESEIVQYTEQLLRYYRDPSWAMGQENKATEATGGNVSFLEAVASALNTRLERLLRN